MFTIQMMSISLQNSRRTYISCSKTPNFLTFCKLQISDKKCPTHPFLLGDLIMQTEWHHRGWSNCWRRRHAKPWYPTSHNNKTTKQIRPFFVTSHFLRLQFENGGPGVPCKPVHFSLNHHWRKSRLTIYLKVVPIFKAQSFVETAGPCTLPSEKICWLEELQTLFPGPTSCEASCSFPDETAEHFRVLVIYSQDTARM